ncbi:hypothetical protein NMG60_11009333 [Bertholletia excelsa]
MMMKLLEEARTPPPQGFPCFFFFHFPFSLPPLLFLLLSSSFTANRRPKLAPPTPSSETQTSCPEPTRSRPSTSPHLKPTHSSPLRTACATAYSSSPRPSSRARPFKPPEPRPSSLGRRF